MAEEWRLEVWGITPYTWNVFKFLLVELVVSVLIRKGYLELLRGRVQSALEESKCMTLWSTTLGRAEPRTINDSRQVFGIRSEEKARSTLLPNTELGKLKAIHPDPSCVKHDTNSTIIMAFDENGACPPSSKSAHESVSLRNSCAMDTRGILIKNECHLP